MIDRHRYFNAVRDALTAFQMVEESLKVTISTCYTYIRSRVRDQLPFSYSRDDVDNLPLRGLLDIYRRLTPNQDIVTALRTLPKDRNYVAHQAFVQEILLTNESLEKISAETERIEAIAKNAYAVLAMMIKEMKRLESSVSAALADEDDT